jgi:UTP--glucose-1-phosphate uridylyltransferase
MQKIRKAVITAAGRGTRQYPATNSIQKELLPVVDVDGYTKPALQIIVEEALASGIEEICIVANPTNANAIRAHFSALTPEQQRSFAGKPWILALSDKLADIAGRLTFVIQDSQEGYGHAVYQARQFVGSDPFLLLLGDHVYISPHVRSAKQLIDQYDTFEAPISSVTLVGEEHLERYGIVKTEPISNVPRASKILKMAEKPSIVDARAELQSMGVPIGMYYAFFGIHALPPAIFDHIKYLIDHDIRSKGEIQFTSAQQLLLRDTELYVAVTVEGKRYDIGVPDGLIETQVALALHSPYASNVYRAVEDVGWTSK